jgi:phage terminase small subunit
LEESEGSVLKPQQKRFCEIYAVSKDGTKSYMEAFGCTERAARASASRLLTNADIKAEIARIRAKAEEKAGSAVMTISEVHNFLSRLVRVNVAKIDIETDGDLLAGVDRVEGTDGDAGIIKLKLPCKLGAIGKWMDLKGEGALASSAGALAALLARVRK